MKKPKIVEVLKQALFPRNITCMQCGNELFEETHFSLCEKCLNSLPRNNGKICQKCGEQIFSKSKYCLRCKNHKPKFTQCFSPLLYKAPVTTFIQQFKYNNGRYLAEPLGNFLVECYLLNSMNCDVVIPVPLHEKRMAERGFNQAELLAKQLETKLHIPLANGILERVRYTQTQTSLTKTQRQENVKKAFKVLEKNFVKGKTILLVDDVYTTGSTLNECARVLFLAGAEKVFCLTLAHTMPENAV